jgi:hypothetical protein
MARSVSIGPWTIWESGDTKPEGSNTNDINTQEYWEARGATYSSSGKKISGPADAPSYVRSGSTPAPEPAAPSFSTTPAKPAIVQPPKAEDTNTVKKVSETSTEKMNALLSKTGLAVTSDVELEKARVESAINSKDIITANTIADTKEPIVAPQIEEIGEYKEVAKTADTYEQEVKSVEEDIKKQESELSKILTGVDDCNPTLDLSGLNGKLKDLSTINITTGITTPSLFKQFLDCLKKLKDSQLGKLTTEISKKAISGELTNYKSGIEILGSRNFPKLPVDLQKLTRTASQIPPSNITDFSKLAESVGIPGDSFVTNTAKGFERNSTLPALTDVDKVLNMGINGGYMADALAGQDAANTSRAFANLQNDYTPPPVPESNQRFTSFTPSFL